MNLIFHPYELQLKHTFTISRESHDTQPSLVVELQADGISGYGEATSNPYYNITLESMQQQLENIKPKLRELPVCSPDIFWQTFEPLLKDNYFALCAFDMAYNDWYARKQQQKLFQLWKLNTDNNPLTNYTIGIDSIDKMIAKLREKPWPIYKIKLGTGNDLDIIRALRKETDAVFRVDANCGWTATQTIEKAKELKKLGVEFIEQPLRADDWEGAKEVYQHSVLPIIADESCIVEADIDKCQGFFHGVNVKLTKCGGLTPGKRMLEKARKLGMKTMVGCMTESTVGISAIAHLLPLLDYVDMDGALLLKEDIAKGVDIKDGKVYYADVAGTGVTLL
jgi:L-alanine-DL-glutamate epimerase-like enolase superfamily enzyme